MEFKCVLEHDFSHPFAACEGGGIVANSIAEGLTFVHDSLDNRGELVPPAPHDSLYGIGRYLTNVHDSDGRVVMSRTDGSRPMRIPVVLFRPLLEATLAPIAHVDWRAPAVVRQPRAHQTQAVNQRHVLLMWLRRRLPRSDAARRCRDSIARAAF